MRQISAAKAGISVGLLLALWHVMWVALVAIGWARAVMDFILRLHFIQLHYDLAPFVLGTAILLVAITFCIGALFGMVFALLWNWLTASQGEVAKFGETAVRA